MKLCFALAILSLSIAACEADLPVVAGANDTQDSAVLDASDDAADATDAIDATDSGGATDAIAPDVMLELPAQPDVPVITDVAPVQDVPNAPDVPAQPDVPPSDVQTSCVGAACLVGVQDEYVKSQNAEPWVFFGNAIAASGNTLVVGEPGESSKSSGVKGDPTDMSVPNAGAVYVYVHTVSGWKQEAYLKSPNTAKEQKFGTSVAISGDTLVAGTDGGEEAIVFVRSNGAWTQQAMFGAPGGNSTGCGRSVAISGDTIAIGCPNASTDKNGKYDPDNSAHTGQVLVYVRSGTKWTLQAVLKSQVLFMNSLFGQTVALDGDLLVASHAVAGAVMAFSRSGSAWTLDTQLSGPSGPSSPTVNLVVAGSTALISNNGSSTYQVVMYGHTGGKWTKAGTLDGPKGTGFGYALAMSGNAILVGAPSDAQGSGGTYLYNLVSGAWQKTAYLNASNPDVGDSFGSAVAIGGDFIGIGAPGEGSNATGLNGDQSSNEDTHSGAVYIFH
jgi:hypothetical protein